MAAGDVEVLAALEAATFSTPWRASTFLRLLDRPGAVLRVVEEEGRILAYAVLWCILDEGELANIAVVPEARGRGVGGELLDHLLEVARRRGVSRLFLEVRGSNDAAHRLYASRGFHQIGTRKAYYDHPREDARVLELRLQEER